MGTTLKFYINERRKNSKTKLCPIYLRVIHNQKKAEGKMSLSPVGKADINYWNKASQRFDTKNKKFITYNIVLNEIQNEFHHYLREHSTIMNEKTPHDIRDYLLSRNSKSKLSLVDALNQFYIEEVLTDKDKAPGTKRNYKKSINHFCNFLKLNKLENIGVQDFKRLHANKFVTYLKMPNMTYNKIALNGQSVNSVIKNIKPFFNKFLFEEKIDFNPFLGVKTPFKRTERPRLTNKDFIQIQKLDLSNNTKLDVYRDLFLFLCYTGLSYCDAINLSSSDIKNSYLKIRRKKSNVNVEQCLPKQVFDLLIKYDGLLPEKRLLPKRSLDKLNLNLKLIAAYANIEIPLTTYTARRFFRQSIYEAGITESMVVKTLMGHTYLNDIDSHYFYIDNDILKAAKMKLQVHFDKLK